MLWENPGSKESGFFLKLSEFGLVRFRNWWIVLVSRQIPADYETVTEKDGADLTPLMILGEG
jgi:hypothetical protein